MLTFNSFSVILFILPAYQMMFYAVQLLTLQKNKNPSRRPLGVLMLLILIYIIINISKYLGYHSVYRYFVFVQLPILLAIIPTYCYYFRKISHESGKIIYRTLVFCFFSSLLVFIINIASYFNMDALQRELFLSSGMPFPTGLHKSISIAVVVMSFTGILLVALQIVMAPIQYLRTITHLKKNTLAAEVVESELLLKLIKMDLFPQKYLKKNKHLTLKVLKIS